MDLPEGSIQSFVIRIWVEETAAEAGNAHWRGHVTHVPSGKRRYFQDLQSMVAFIQPYVHQLGHGGPDAEA
jgi:hypothetical protein